ncbi:MAG TPA: alternative ribosome rescue aminoacyl-tRNA hydrolase ArfB [Rhizomicrobium sp.]|jgi:ribosome-associated protein|nr:alternative ribosome rescue aminoacyl-tRNA hydrolase ArfB [Rhizomicrobium sp.]
MSVLFINHRIAIPESELEERFIRSQGPGGQNVNKVASAVQLRFDVRASASLTEAARDALLESGRLTREGVLVITARRFREQEKNRADARARLVEIVRRAAQPRRVRRPTKVPAASRRLRLEGKKHRARVKQARSRPPAD